METKLKIRPFAVPNFVIVELPPSANAGGFQSAPSIPIHELTDEVLEGLLIEFRENLHAKVSKFRPSNLMPIRQFLR
jgi:hypothetical protein